MAGKVAEDQQSQAADQTEQSNNTLSPVPIVIGEKASFPNLGGSKVEEPFSEEGDCLACAIQDSIQEALEKMADDT